MSTLFEYVDDVMYYKKNLIIDKESEKNYNAFMINRTLSLHPDTILYAQEMNQNSHLDNKMQNDYYINTLRKAKRFAKWPKKEADDIIQLIQRYYECNYRNAKNCNDNTFLKKQIKKIQESLF